MEPSGRNARDGGSVTLPPGRILALDYGRARCGCAVSDPSQTIATPLDPIIEPASEPGIARVAELVAEQEASGVLVGLPVGLSGREGPQAAETREFVESLRPAVTVPVETYDERFTTAMARRTPGSSSEDSRAAAHLLEAYMGRRGGESR